MLIKKKKKDQKIVGIIRNKILFKKNKNLKINKQEMYLTYKNNK